VKVALVALLAILGPRVVPAQPAGCFARGNDEYEAGRFDRALALYDSAAAAGSGAAVYYNRGNAYFRLGEVGRAIADYSRAWVMRPHDRYARHNLAFARQFRPDRTGAADNQILRGITDFFRLPDVWTARLGAGLCFLLAASLLGLFFVHGRRFLLWAAVGLAALFCYGLVSTVSWAAVVDPDRAVVIVPELTLRAGPGAEYKDIAVVHDGLEVTVRERRPEWLLVQVPGGEGGWVEVASIEAVFPRPTRIPD